MLRLEDAENVTKDDSDSLLETVNIADGDTDVVIHNVDDALFEDVAEFEFEAVKVEPTDLEARIVAVLDGDGLKVASIDGDEVCVSEFDSVDLDDDDDDADVDDVIVTKDDSVD